ncbi:MAG: hypothetical protein GY881_01715 [Gammaproteobacteria bacterium]|jgi:hypothetical protein|nr:hypothetical protein [Gammaproteobacteria bacterium]MCP4881442.1 hypothetical protein [Gammaproteobacteria bacterium]
MEYKWLIVVLVVLSLLGSISWAMPTPMQRAQAKIRKLAMAKGVQIRVGKLQGPREEGEMTPEGHLATGYNLPRPSETAKHMAKTHNWEVFRANGLHKAGLPRGWCWNRGEGALTDKQLQDLAQLIGRLPKDVYAIGASPIGVVAYWHEVGTPKELDDLITALQGLLEHSL